MSNRYGIDVVIDPSGAQRGSDVVQRELSNIDKAAARTKAQLDQATKFNTAGATSSASQMADAILEMEAALRKEYAAERAATSARDVATTAIKNQDRALVQLNSHMDLWRKHSASALAGQKALESQVKLTNNQLLNLSFQLNDVITGLASGQRPLQILGQQAGQVVQALQLGPKGMAGSLQAIKNLIPPMLGPIAALTGAFLILAGVLLSGRKEAAEYSNVISLTGGRLGVTTDQLNEFTKSAADAANIGLRPAKEALLALASTGKFSGEQLGQVTEVVARLAALSGRSATEVAGDFSSMGDDVASFAQKFSERYGGIDADILNNIRRLQEQGQTAKAQAEFILAAQQTLAERGEAQLGILERAWRGVANAIGGAIQNLKEFGAGGDIGIKKELDDVNKRLESLKNDPLGKLFGTTAVLEQRREALQKTLDAHHAAAEAAGADAKAASEAAAARNELNTTYSRGVDSQEKYTSAVKRYQETLAKAGRDGKPVDSAERQAAVMKQLWQENMPKAYAAQQKLNSASESAAKKAANLAERLREQEQAQNALIQGNLALSRAYDTSEAEALKQIAVTEAQVKVAKDGGDVARVAARQLDENASKAAASASKEAFELRQKVDIQTELNAMVRDGLLTSSEAAEQMTRDIVILGLRAQAAAASGEAQEELNKAIDKMLGGQRKQSVADYTTQLLGQTEAQDRQNEVLALEATLIGKSNAERATALAQLQAEQALRGKFGIDPADASAFTASVVKGATTANDNEQRQEAYNQSLVATLNLLNDIDAAAQSAADGLASSFGRVGSAIGGAITALTSYQAKMEDIRVREADYFKNSIRTKERDAEFDRERMSAQIEGYSGAIGAAKSFFKEQSAGYKLLEGAERAWRIVQIGLTLASIAAKSTETAAVVANETVQTGAVVAGSTARATAKGAEGVAGIFAALGPFGFPVAAAAIAVMAAAGVSALGGGRAAPGATDAADRQAAQGSGSILGDAKGKSDSISKALEIAGRNSNKDLEYSSQMVRSLKAIEDNIGAVANLLSRQLGAGGALSTDGLGLGKVSSSASGGQTAFAGLLGGVVGIALTKLLPGLFGSKTTTSLQDQGLDFSSQSVGDILGGGINGSTYQQVATTTKKKFLGVTYSNKTGVNTTSSDLADDLSRQLGLLVESLRGGVVSAATALGVTGAEATIDAFVVNIGKISFKDLTGAEIEEQLNAVFGKLGDDLAAAALPVVTEFQKVGEGAFETLVRLARDYEVVDQTLASMSKSFGQIGVSSLAARENLIALAGGIDALVEQTSFFTENFLSDAERLAPIQKSVTSELSRLGFTSITTKDQFKDLVLAQDLSTEAGQGTYTALLKLAPAFSKMIDLIESAAEATDSYADRLAEARDVLMEAYDRESKALQQTIDKFQAFTDALKKFRDTLYFGANAQLSPEEQYRASKAQFEQTAARARNGDVTAIEELQNVSQAYLDASREYYASSEGYFEDLSAVKAAVEATLAYTQGQVDIATRQLNAMTEAVTQLGLLNQNVVSFTQALANYLGVKAGGPAGAAGGVPSASNDNGGPGQPNSMATGVMPTQDEINKVISALDLKAGGPTGMDPQAYANMLITSFRDGQLALESGTGQVLAGLFGGRDDTPNDSSTTSGYNSNNTNKSEAYKAAEQAVWDAINNGDSASYSAAQEAFRKVQGYAEGGAFLGSGVVMQPTMFNQAKMAEENPEAIMPLVRGPRGLGVRASIANADNKAVEAKLDAVIVELKAANLQRGMIGQAELSAAKDLRRTGQSQVRATRVATAK